MNEEWNIIQDDNAHHNLILQNGYTGCDLVVKSQYQVGKYQPGPNEVCISIGSSRFGIKTEELSKDFKDICVLEFDDVGVADADDPTAKNLTASDASRVIKFVADYIDNTDKIVIHCYAGISRSRSMAAALSHCFDLPFAYTVLNKPVYKLICNAYHDLRSVVE